MRKDIKSGKTVSIEELVVSNIYTQEAIINVLFNKGLVTRDEIINEIRSLKIQAEKKRG